MLQFVSGTENEDADHANTLVALAKELLALGNRVRLNLPMHSWLLFNCLSGCTQTCWTD